MRPAKASERFGDAENGYDIFRVRQGLIECQVGQAGGPREFPHHFIVEIGKKWVEAHGCQDAKGAEAVDFEEGYVCVQLQMVLSMSFDLRKKLTVSGILYNYLYQKE